MKIAFDAKRAFLNKSGLGNYSRSLILSMLEHFPENDYQLFSSELASDIFQHPLLHQSNVKVHQPLKFLDKQIPSLWRSYSITKQLIHLQTDVYHGLSNELPFSISNFKGKKIVSIHDLIYLRYPDLYPLIDRNTYDRKSRVSCEHADVVIAISEQTKKDLIDFYHVPEDKIKVVYQSCSDLFYTPVKPQALDGLREKYQLPEKFLLTVGTIEERKDLLTLVKALTSVDAIPLVVVGRKRKYHSKIMNFIQENGLTNRIYFYDQVSNEELPAFYQLASIFIFPSKFEGFGIPILEALNSKVPVIAALNSSLPEVGGKDSLYFTTGNYRQLSELIRNVLSAPNLAQKMVEKGISQALKFRPEVISNQLMQIYSS